MIEESLKTGIICTIGPTSDSEDTLAAMMTAGMNVARLNFSHGTVEYHAEVIRRIRKVAGSMELPVAILQNEQPRVQISPMIIMVAWPWLQHSPTFGQPASSHTVTRLFSRMILCVSAYPIPPGALTRIHFGFIGCSLSGRCAFSGWRCWGILRSRMFVRAFVRVFQSIPRLGRDVTASIGKQPCTICKAFRTTAAPDIHAAGHTIQVQ